MGQVCVVWLHTHKDLLIKHDPGVSRRLLPPPPVPDGCAAGFGSRRGQTGRSLKMEFNGF